MATKPSTNRSRAASGNGDSPTVHKTLAALVAKETAPGPYVLGGLAGGARITFPDPGDMGWVEAEQFLMDMDNKGPSEVFEGWLSEEDYQVLRETKMNWRTLMALMREVRSHYSDIFGAPGEGDASLT